ncbi:hypothetical protein [uncultured Paracoccus sp.]|uniref:hypothetical protein n=1 Tax=uncultured Paracoccus sp. TaxID=189685 RepID=UPI002612090D|nr:hypothetical protein [uncultured Paracoccus sp.]
MTFSIPTLVLSVAAALGTAATPVLAQQAQTPAPTPQITTPVAPTPDSAAATTPAVPQGTTPALQQRGKGGDCPWKSKNLMS